MTFENLEMKVVEWSRDRGILTNGKAVTQLLKAISEMGELADAYAKDRPDEVRDAVGDILVCLINFTRLYNGTDLVWCLSAAYDEIKDRKGYLTSDGLFIKEGK